MVPNLIPRWRFDLSEVGISREGAAKEREISSVLGAKSRGWNETRRKSDQERVKSRSRERKGRGGNRKSKNGEDMFSNAACCSLWGYLMKRKCSSFCPRSLGDSEYQI